MVVTKSSIDSANASSAPAITPGMIIGRVTSRNVSHGPAPRSWAASSSDRSRVSIRARTVIATKDMQNTTCARRMVTSPVDAR